MGEIITDWKKIKKLLKRTRAIAIIGISLKPERDSYKDAKYLNEKVYKIIPIRPGQKEILGEKPYLSLDELPVPDDIINVFKKSDLILPHAEEAIINKLRAFWIQLNIKNKKVAELLMNEGINVIINKFIKAEHAKLFK